MPWPITEPAVILTDVRPPGSATRLVAGSTSTIELPSTAATATRMAGVAQVNSLSLALSGLSTRATAPVFGDTVLRMFGRMWLAIKNSYETAGMTSPDPVTFVIESDDCPHFGNAPRRGSGASERPAPPKRASSPRPSPASSSHSSARPEPPAETPSPRRSRRSARR